MLKPIRPTALTSLLAKDEVKNRSRSEELRQLGDSVGEKTVSTPGRELRVIGGRMAGRHCSVNQGSRTGNSDGVHGLISRSEESCPEGDRAFVGARKRGNARGAKEGRDVEAEEQPVRPRKAGVVPARAERARDRVPPEWSAMSACLWTQEGNRKPRCRMTFSSRGPTDACKSRVGPLLGEPDAGDPPVRFGRGSGESYRRSYLICHQCQSLNRVVATRMR
jgi:hypothetical protein